MAEKEVQIKVTTETDISDVEDLETKLQELKDSKVQLQLESDTAELEELNGQIEETQAKLDELRADPTVDDSEIQALEEELAELESRKLDLEISVNTAELEQAKATMDELEAASQSATGSIDGVGSALTAVAATAGLEQMVTTADNINNSWNRLELTFGSVSDSMKQSISSAAEVTGRSGGTIRDYFNQMGIAGVTNTDLLAQSFESLSGRAYQTGASIETMENVMQRMVLSGNAGTRQLAQLGISTEALGKAMGVSADEATKAFSALSQEDRLRVLTQAMGDGKQANEMYKNSFQGLKSQAEAAFAGLVGAVGQTILPVVIPMLNLAKDAILGLTNVFKSLPGPVQAIIGGLGGVALAGAALIGTLGVVGQIVSTVRGGIQALSGIMRAWEAVTKMVELAQAALNLVMSLNPIFLVVAAIIVLIAILWYLYNTNESVREAIDGFISALWSIGETIYGYLVGAFEWLQGAWQNTVDFFTNGGQVLQDTLGGAFQWLMDIWTMVVNAFMTYAPLIAQVLFVMATGGIGAIVLLIANMNGMPNQIGAILQSVISRVVSWVSNIVSQFTSGAQRAVSGFLSPLSGLVDAVSAELSAVYSAVMSFIQPLIDAFNALGSAASWAFSVLGMGQGSPGNIYEATMNELEWTTQLVEKDKTGLVKAMGLLGEGVVKSWGSPNLSFSVQGDVNANNSNGAVGNIERLLTQLIDLLRNNKSSGNNISFTLNGDMDNEDRMEKFVEEIIRRLYWENDTAGRNMEVL